MNLSTFNDHDNSRWGREDAAVVCRQLGYSGGEPVHNGRFGSGNGFIWLDNVECYGDETRLTNCIHNGWGVSNCGHHEDAGVICLCKSWPVDIWAPIQYKDDILPV